MELAFHRWLRENLPEHPRVKLSVGDDAAVLQLDSRECVVTTDTISDEVDFELQSTDIQRIGHKALGVNLSDLAAMAAQPVGCVVALLLPEENAAELARGILQGMLPLAEEFDCPIAGGDVHIWKHPLAITVTAIGQVTAGTAARRTGAQPGDAIVVTGAFGGSLLGRHFDVRPRVKEMLSLQAEFDIHAAIDCSDGLSLDLHRLAQASGLGAEMQANQIPIHADAARRSLTTNQQPLEHALSDGEDFELILAVPMSDANRMLKQNQKQRQQDPMVTPLAIIGQFTQQPGLWINQADGTREALTPRGYEHGS